MTKKKHLPKAVFEVGATAIARIHVATGRPLSSIAKSIWAEYERQCEDASAEKELAAAAEAVLLWIQERNLPSREHLLRHLQYFCQAFDDDGRPKKKKLLGGLWFQSDTYQPDRVQAYLRKAQVYCASAQSGLVPLAPEGYQ
jgi:hypothetical protein